MKMIIIRYLIIPKNNIFIYQHIITHIHATDADLDSSAVVNYYFTNKDHYAYFHLYSNGSIVLYNLNDLHLPICLEIYAGDQGHPRALNSEEKIVIYICDIYRRNECLSNKLRRKFYLGSIFIMISVVLFLCIIIMCIIWNLFIRKQISRKENNKSYKCRMEARKNLSKKNESEIFFFYLDFFLVVSDSLDESSPTINEDHRCKDVVV
jgi:hypothetical protein